MRAGKVTVIMNMVDHWKKRTSSQLPEEEDELETSAKKCVVQV